MRGLEFRILKPSFVGPFARTLTPYRRSHQRRQVHYRCAKDQLTTNPQIPLISRHPAMNRLRRCTSNARHRCKERDRIPDQDSAITEPATDVLNKSVSPGAVSVDVGETVLPSHVLVIVGAVLRALHVPRLLKCRTQGTWESGFTPMLVRRELGE